MMVWSSGRLERLVHGVHVHHAFGVYGKQGHRSRAVVCQERRIVELVGERGRRDPGIAAKSAAQAVEVVFRPEEHAGGAEAELLVSRKVLPRHREEASTAKLMAEVLRDQLVDLVVGREGEDTSEATEVHLFIVASMQHIARPTGQPIQARLAERLRGSCRSETPGYRRACMPWPRPRAHW